MAMSQIKTNHLDCPAGTDTKQRLYLKQTHEGILAYCHHCGKGGFLRTSREPSRLETLLAEKVGEASKVKGNPFVGPTTQFKEWPTEPKLWWLSHELNEEDANTYGVTWHPDSHRLLLPSCILVQGRGFYGQLPKYLTYHKPLEERGPYTSVSLFDGGSTCVFVVEDLVSAYKIHKCGGNVLSLTGTKFTDAHLNMCAVFERVVLWTDDDPAGIVGSAAMYKALSGLCEVITFRSTLEPKETDLETLKTIVERYNA